MTPKYNPTLIGECEKAIQWSEEMARDWLITGMLDGEASAEQTADTIIKELCDHSLTMSHARHLSPEKCKEIGLKIVDMEADQALQEAILSVHHACMITLGQTPAAKLIENHDGVAYIQSEHTVMMAPNRTGEAI